MQIVFKKDVVTVFGRFKKEETATVSDDYASLLIADGIAEARPAAPAKPKAKPASKASTRRTRSTK